MDSFIHLDSTLYRNGFDFKFYKKIIEILEPDIFSIVSGTKQLQIKPTSYCSVLSKQTKTSMRMALTEIPQNHLGHPSDTQRAQGLFKSLALIYARHCSPENGQNRHLLLPLLSSDRKSQNFEFSPKNRSTGSFARAVSAISNKVPRKLKQGPKRSSKCSTDTGGGLTGDSDVAPTALLGEEVSVAVGAVRLLVLRSELDASQLLFTVGAGEAFLVPRLPFVRDAAPPNHLEEDFKEEYQGDEEKSENADMREFGDQKKSRSFVVWGGAKESLSYLLFSPSMSKQTAEPLYLLPPLTRAALRSKFMTWTDHVTPLKNAAFSFSSSHLSLSASRRQISNTRAPTSNS